MSLIIAGDRSNSGKTTITLAILAFLAQKQAKIQSFKVGPDYIDPMFHTAITNRPCRNLDPVLTSPSYVKSCFLRHCQDVEYALIEGVMGLFDGIGAKDGEKDFASSAHLARLLDLPILLVVDCSRLSTSIAAIVHGYISFDPRIKIAGIVLNKVGSSRHLELLTQALENLPVNILGVFPKTESITIADRHLGLVPTTEIPQLREIFHNLAHLAKSNIIWDQLVPFLQIKTSPPASLSACFPLSHPSSPNIAVARDKAFNFYYQDNLDILTQLGARLTFWSPMTDEKLPQNIQGMYFGGGFPEVFASELAENQAALTAVRQAIKMQIPIYAECGGLMYLCQSMIDFAGKSWQMVGAIPTTTAMTQKLTLGYRQATALQETILLPQATQIWGHEFHRSQLNPTPTEPIYQMHNAIREGWAIGQIHASYLHLHFGDKEHIAKKWLDTCSAKKYPLQSANRLNLYRLGTKGGDAHG